MKKMVLLLLITTLISQGYSQETEELKTVDKKKEQKQEEKTKYDATKKLLESKAFVLEADYLQDRRGNRIMVNSTINFIKIEEEEGIIQIGSDYTIGENGVGGVTAKGNITRWKLNEVEKKKYFNLTVHILTNIGSYDVNFSINHEGRATARVTGLQSGFLIFDGDIVPLIESRAYEGTSI